MIENLEERERAKLFQFIIFVIFNFLKFLNNTISLN
jgi:hypothetical protein